ncbi:MAG: mechanosensitive ion channel family protein [Syntrophales bacterium]|nr:mechanosensitive ion channel family protein [Syntrophales bacterium]
MNWLDSAYFGNAVNIWLLTALIILSLYLVLEIGRKTLLKHLSKPRFFSERAAALAADLIRNTRTISIIVFALYIGSFNLDLPAKAANLAKTATILVLLLQAAFWGNRAITFWVSEYQKRKMREDAAGVTTITALSYAGRVVMWIILVLIALDNMGVNITAMIAGLGIGGIAVALAVQNVLKDLFASLSIILDKPFVYGDFIIVGDYMGSVEHIGLKTTRIKSLSGEQIVFSNSDLLESRIRNYQRLQERRAVFTIGVTYQTPYEKIKMIPELIREIIEKREKARVERVHFSGYGASELKFEAAWWIAGPDYKLYMDLQQEIFLDIFRRFEEEGIEFAYPTQTLFIEKIAMPERDRKEETEKLRSGKRAN